MANPLSFERYRQAQAPPPLPPGPPNPPGITGRLPLRTGTGHAQFVGGAVPDPKAISPGERAGLARLGLGPGDPVPDNMADVVAEYIAEAKRTDTYSPVPPGTEPLRMPPEVMIERLPQAMQDEIRASIQIYKQSGIGKIAANPELLDVKPGLREAMRTALIADAEPVPRVSAHPPVAPAPAPQPAATPVTEAPAASVSGGDLPVTHCPRCGCDIAHYETIVPTPEEKYAYLMMILGGPTARFREDVKLFGGAVTVTFRSLTAADGRLVMERVRLDHLETPIVGELNFFARVTEYRMAMALDRVVLGATGEQAVPISDSPKMLAVVVGWLRDEVLASESLVRAVGEAFKEFQRLVEALEEKAEEPDFWKGIAAPR